jgi:sigma-B regulation protein RsbU (phosphoserine phosphatase)
LRPRCGEPVRALQPALQPLGVVAEWAESAAPRPVHILPSGSLVLISDGVFEAANGAGEQFGLDRVERTLDEQPDTCTPGEIITAVRAAVEEWQGADEPEDDQTIVVVQRRGDAR